MNLISAVKAALMRRWIPSTVPAVGLPAVVTQRKAPQYKTLRRNLVRSIGRRQALKTIKAYHREGKAHLIPGLERPTSST